MPESSPAPTIDEQIGDEKGGSDPLHVVPGVSQRTDFSLIPSKVALLIVDIQEYLSDLPSERKEGENNSYLYETSLVKVLPNVHRLVEHVRNLRDDRRSHSANVPPPPGCEVVFTYLEALTPDCRDVSLDYKLSGPFLATQLPNRWTNPAKFLTSPPITPESHDIVIPKTSCSVFISTNLNYVLRNLQIEQLVVCGQLTNQCVESAVRDAADLGYFVTVVDDACAATSADAHQRGLLGMQGFCRTCTTDQVIQELKAGTGADSIVTTTTTTSTTKTTTIAVTKEALPSLPPTISSNQSLSVRSAQEFSKSRALSTQVDGLTTALLRSLQGAGVKFLRYMTVDVCNSIRCKTVPLDHLFLQRPSHRNCKYHHPVHSAAVSVAQICMAGLPSFGDVGLPEATGLNAQDVLAVHADWSTLRILPYAPKSAVVLGTLFHPPKPSALRSPDSDGSLSPLCTRGLLQRVVETAELDHGIGFSVGAELEFCLYSAKTNQPVDQSVFANSTTLNQQEAFISDLYDQIQGQQLPVELIHAESAPGQLEIVLSYQTNPVLLADCVLLAKETVQAVANKHGLKALFLPKIFGDKAGSGLHVHLSYYRYADNKTDRPVNAFCDPNTGLLTQGGGSFLEGILQHLPALTALTMPTVNSFRRVGAGCWTGSVVGWAVEDKEAALRVCSSLVDGAYTNVEYKLSDATSNLYLSLAAMLSCGLQGILLNLPLRPSLLDLDQVNAQAEPLPTNVEGSLQALERDELLQQVLGPSLLRAYVGLRRAEAEQAANKTLEEQVQEALLKA